MDTLPSAQFRKAYGKLKRPTVVTVNGRAIGVWSPAEQPFPGLEVPTRSHHAPDAAPVKMTQAERDRILRRIATHD